MQGDTRILMPLLESMIKGDFNLEEEDCFVSLIDAPLYEKELDDYQTLILFEIPKRGSYRGAVHMGKPIVSLTVDSVQISWPYKQCIWLQTPKVTIEGHQLAPQIVRWVLIHSKDREIAVIDVGYPGFDLSLGDLTIKMPDPKYDKIHKKSSFWNNLFFWRKP